MRSFRQGRRKSLEENAGHRATEIPHGTHANQLHQIRAQKVGGAALMECARMGTQTAPIDPVERDLAAAQLDDIALANQERGWAVWKEVVLAWHLEAVAHARAEAWVPGLARSQDPVVEEVLGRFYRHHMRATVVRLKAENLELQRKLIDAVACVRFYETGATDAGERAHSMLASLKRYAGAGATKAGPPH
jgi:hypothetical protein